MSSKNSISAEEPIQASAIAAPLAMAKAKTAAAAAEDAVSAAGDRAREAYAKNEAAKEALAAAEREAVEAFAAAGTGDPEGSRARLDNARAQLDKARSDAEWARLQVDGWEAAYSRAADAGAAASRAVTAQEYRAAHKAYNDPHSRENVLLAQLTETVAELFQVIDTRMALHDRLAQVYGGFPDDEKITDLQPGLPIITYGYRGQGTHEVQLPFHDMAEAVKAGIARFHQGARPHAALTGT